MVPGRMSTRAATTRLAIAAAARFQRFASHDGCGGWAIRGGFRLPMLSQSIFVLLVPLIRESAQGPCTPPIIDPPASPRCDPRLQADLHPPPASLGYRTTTYTDRILALLADTVRVPRSSNLLSLSVCYYIYYLFEIRQEIARPALDDDVLSPRSVLTAPHPPPVVAAASPQSASSSSAPPSTPPSSAPHTPCSTAAPPPSRLSPSPHRPSGDPAASHQPTSRPPRTANQPADQPTSHPASQPASRPPQTAIQPADQPTSQPTSQPASRPAHQPASPPASQPASRPTTHQTTYAAARPNPRRTTSTQPPSSDATQSTTNS